MYIVRFEGGDFVIAQVIKAISNFELGMVKTPEMPEFGKLDKYEPLTKEELQRFSRGKDVKK